MRTFDVKKHSSKWVNSNRIKQIFFRGKMNDVTWQPMAQLNKQHLSQGLNARRMWYRNLRSSLSQSGDCSTSGSLNMFSLVIFHSKKLSSINFLLQFDCVFSIELQFLPLMRIVWKQARIQAIIRRSEARGITRCNVNILSISNYSLLISHLDVLPCKQLNFCNSDSYKIPF